MALALAGPLAGWLRLRGAAAAVWAVVPAGCAAWLWAQSRALESGGTVLVQTPWFAALGASLDFRLDGWSAFMALLVCGVGALVLVYAAGYLGKHPSYGRFQFYLFSFMAAMLGVVLADNIILMFVFWELTGITSFLLIGFVHERAEARAKALQAGRCSWSRTIAACGPNSRCSRGIWHASDLVSV